MSASAQDMRERLKRWPLLAQPSNRNEGAPLLSGVTPTKDARIVNGYAELDPNTGDYWVQKRIGYIVAFANLITFGLGRGMYTWITVGGATGNPVNYAIIGNGLNASLFKNGIVTGAALGLGDSPGNWSFTETQGATRYMVFAGVQISPNLYYTTGSGYTLATLPAGRGNVICGLAYLDGTIYFMDELCQIFGSALEDPTTWTTLNMIPAKKIPGTGIWLGKQGVYVIALKSSGMEVFQDGAGAPPGSPLVQIDGATNTFGCANRDTVQTIDGTLIYVTSNQTASPQIVRIDNLVPTIISTPAIERLLDTSQGNGGTFSSWVFKHAGHRFYGITNDVTQITLVYDLDQNRPMGLWYQWTDTDGTYFKMQSTGINNTYLHWFLTTNTGTIFQFAADFTFPTDNGVVAPVDIYTPNEDFGTQRTKTLFRMNIRGDQKIGSTLFIRRSDDDYQTWSTFRKVDMGKATPYIDNEGTFVRRAYNFRHAAPTSFRIRSSDLQMELGTI